MRYNFDEQGQVLFSPKLISKKLVNVYTNKILYNNINNSIYFFYR